jgi:hypothetical protein
MVLVVLHRTRAKAYLAAYETRYGHRDPGARWIVRRDKDPEVERLRRLRLLVVLPASVLLLLGIWLIVYAPG